MISRIFTFKIIQINTNYYLPNFLFLNLLNIQNTIFIQEIIKLEYAIFIIYIKINITYLHSY